MRLLVSRASAEEQLLVLLNEGYRLRQELWAHYAPLWTEKAYIADYHYPLYERKTFDWLDKVEKALAEIFPTTLERNLFRDRPSFSAVVYRNEDPKFAHLYYAQLPLFLDRLKSIRNSELPLYTDLPLKERLYVEDIDSFVKVRDVHRDMVAPHLQNGFLNRSEDNVQMALEQILSVSFHRNDWGGEINDLYTANVIVNGARRATAFLLKGPGIGRREMAISDCGKRGDQIVRLFETPADLFVIQYVGPIADMVVKDVESKVRLSAANGKPVHFLIIDGQDTARLMLAYGKM